jgi:hypothetical protein
LLQLTSRGIRTQRKADEFKFAVDLFDWKTGEQITSENLNLCLTSSAECYTEIQEKERKKETQENQEKQEKKEIQEMQREARAQLPRERKCVITQRPYIPTSAELAQQLERTAHLRTGLKSLNSRPPAGE